MAVLKMRFKIGLFLVLFTISAASAEKAVVKRIIDGDTLSVFSGGKILKIRLIGIDAPESKGNKKAHRNSNRSGKDIKTIILQGKQAVAFIKRYLKKGDVVFLEFDIDKQDKYGRVLAYVYLSDGRFLNDLIISSGYASPLTIAPNIKHKDLFFKSYQTAREKKIGLWAMK
jgi:micrococcal nuclease